MQVCHTNSHTPCVSLLALCRRLGRCINFGCLFFLDGLNCYTVTQAVGFALFEFDLRTALDSMRCSLQSCESCMANKSKIEVEIDGC